MQRSGWKALFVVLLAALVGLGTGSRAVVAAPSTSAGGRSVTSTAASSSSTSIDADAYVKQSKPTRNYGLDNTVNVSGTDDPRKGYVKFTISNVSGSISHAVLRLYVTDNGTKDGPQLYSTNNSWSETAINWNNAPPAGSLLDDKGALPKNTWAEYDITALVAGGNGTYSVLLLGQGGDSVDFSSRQGSHPPQVVLTLAAFHCPAQDYAGFPLDVNNTSTDPIFCSYPVFPGEDPNDFFCTYSATDGHLVQDNDAGLCPGAAVSNSARPSAAPTNQGSPKSKTAPATSARPGGATP